MPRIKLENWSEEKDKLIQELSEKGGYLFVPEEDKKKGMVLKLEKEGVISDVVLSFGYEKAIPDKKAIIGTSIKDYHNRFKGKTFGDKIKTEKDVETYKYSKLDGIQIPKEHHWFDFEKMYQIDEAEFNKYKQAEEEREDRYKKAKEGKDPLEDRIEFSPAERAFAPSDEYDKKVLALNVKNFNKTKIIHNLYQMCKNRSRR